MRARIGIGFWSCAASAAALLTGTVSASAQTVIATNAPPRSTVEYILNMETVGSATADESGNATIAPKQAGDRDRAGMEAHVYVDTCDTLRRVLIINRNQQPPPEGAGCQRAQVAGIFLVRPVSTLVIDVEGPVPTVLLRQGRFSLEQRLGRTWSPPTSLVLFGAPGLARITDPVDRACGNITDCSGSASGLALTGGVELWFNRFLAAEVSYLRPDEVTAEGRAGDFSFNSTLDAHVLTIAGKVGGPVGPARLYGKGGATYHWATFATTQTNEDVTVTTDGVTTTIEGGTQTFELRTRGWSWLVGGGVEVWLKPAFGLYLEGGRVGMKGSAVDDADGEIDDGIAYVVLGARVAIGR
jgi:hypothetical protein